MNRIFHLLAVILVNDQLNTKNTCMMFSTSRAENYFINTVV